MFDVVGATAPPLFTMTSMPAGHEIPDQQVGSPAPFILSAWCTRLLPPSVTQPMGHRLGDDVGVGRLEVLGISQKVCGGWRR